MKTWECQICGFVYNPAKGSEETGIRPNTSFAKLPPNWKCPGCGSEKDIFQEIQEDEEC